MTKFKDTLRNDYKIFVAQYLEFADYQKFFKTSKEFYNFMKKDRKIDVKELEKNYNSEDLGWLSIFTEFCLSYDQNKSLWNNNLAKEQLDKLIKCNISYRNIDHHFIKNILSELENKEHIPNIIQQFYDYIVEMTGYFHCATDPLKTSLYKAFRDLVKNPADQLKYFVTEEFPEFLTDFALLSMNDKKIHLLERASSKTILKMQSLFQCKELIDSFSSQEILSLVQNISTEVDNSNLSFFKEFCDENIMGKLSDNNIENLETMFRLMSNSLEKIDQKSGSALFNYFLNNMNINDENKAYLLEYCKAYCKNKYQIDLSLKIMNSKNIETDSDINHLGELEYYAAKLLKNIEEKKELDSKSVQTEEIIKNNKLLLLNFLVNKCSQVLGKEDDVNKIQTNHVKVGIKTTILTNLLQELEEESNNISIQTDETLNQNQNFEEAFQKIIGNIGYEE